MYLSFLSYYEFSMHRMKPMAKTSVMAAWSFELYLYLEQTVPQLSDCCPLGRLVFYITLYSQVMKNDSYAEIFGQ